MKGIFKALRIRPLQRALRSLRARLALRAVQARRVWRGRRSLLSLRPWQPSRRLLSAGTGRTCRRTPSRHAGQPSRHLAYARARILPCLEILKGLGRPFTWPFWAPRLRLLICLVYLLVTGGLSVVQIWNVYTEKAKYLYCPDSWVLRNRGRETRHNADIVDNSPGMESVGGGSLGVLPIDIKLYSVREGDTLSDIAERFAMDLDTIASLNREWGSGVHLIQIGEAIQIPNQNGIFIPVSGDLDALCAEKSVPVEVVLQVNQLDRGQVEQGMELFFPGVQHTGIERSVVTGTAFLRPVVGFLSSGFGYRRDPFTNEMHFHRGIDLAAPVGTVIRAALDGAVVVVGNDPVLGNYILIRHQIGYSSLYGHLHQVWVNRGSTVTRGQRIGTVGNTGRSTGPHLHFEIRRRGVPINAWGLLSFR